MKIRKPPPHTYSQVSEGWNVNGSRKCHCSCEKHRGNTTTTALKFILLYFTALPPLLFHLNVCSDLGLSCCVEIQPHPSVFNGHWLSSVILSNTNRLILFLFMLHDIRATGSRAVVTRFIKTHNGENIKLWSVSISLRKVDTLEPGWWHTKSCIWTDINTDSRKQSKKQKMISHVEY